MGTATIEGALVLKVPAELLGPGSEYERRLNLLRKDINQLVLDASKITQVTTPEELESANDACRVLQASKKEVEVFYTPLKRQVDAFKAPLLMHEKEFAIPIDVEQKRLSALSLKFLQEEEAKRREAERIAREEADKAAREEALNRAIEIEATDGKEAAEQFLEEPIMAAPVVMQSVAPVKLPGQVLTKRWKVRVTNSKAFYAAIGEGKLSEEYAPIDIGKLNRRANDEKQGFNVPGCVAEPEDGLHHRT